MKNIVNQKDYHLCHQAPLLIITSNRPNYENGIVDCALALENIFLAAESMGLGSCYINLFHWFSKETLMRDYLAELGIPRDHVICGSAAVGHIGKPTEARPRKEGSVIKIM